MLGILYINRLKKLIPLENAKILDNEIILTVHPKNLIGVITFLKHNVLCQFICLTAISGTDYPERENRFEVAYELLSVYHNRRVRVKTFVNEVTPLNSITLLYRAANWWEREIWDLFGVFFKDHPDLRRILTDYGFQGHPLRKDFPLSGYVEVSYDEKLKRVISQPLELTQEFRSFDFRSPWSTSFASLKLK
uniref:NADH dehydrogenase subunit 9 n=1 Tax=Monodopsis sp. MarTras21 TaxID=1745953 RepID=A0A140F2X6_9STRA|nr:NADH dehydrogenase subunit 9 [Monodopsis sp. MarTras21]